MPLRARQLYATTRTIDFAWFMACKPPRRLRWLSTRAVLLEMLADCRALPRRKKRKRAA